MQKEIKDKIGWRLILGRIQADARDTYNWLNLRDKKIAEEFRLKMNKMEKYFKAEEKERKMLDNALVGKMEWGEPEKVEKTKDGKIIKTWWRKLLP